jgi:hypothetical protein
VNVEERDAEVRRLAGQLLDEMIAAGVETVGDLPADRVRDYRARLEELGLDPSRLRLEHV